MDPQRVDDNVEKVAASSKNWEQEQTKRSKRKPKSKRMDKKHKERTSPHGNPTGRLFSISRKDIAIKARPVIIGVPRTA